MRFCILFLATILTAYAFGQTICIDPGHPSENGRGSKGKRLTEVEVAWRVGVRLRELLEKDGYRVVMTKSEQEQTVTNRERARIANDAKSDLLLRLHCDAASGTGISAYYPKETGKAHGVEGPSETVRKQSGDLAKRFFPALIASLDGKHRSRGLLTDRQTAIGNRQGALTGSIFSKVPVILVELAVLTNPKDEAFLESKAGFEALCQALLAGVRAAIPPKAGFASSP